MDEEEEQGKIIGKDRSVLNYGEPNNQGKLYIRVPEGVKLKVLDITDDDQMQPIREGWLQQAEWKRRYDAIYSKVKDPVDKQYLDDNWRGHWPILCEEFLSKAEKMAAKKVDENAKVSKIQEEKLA